MKTISALIIALMLLTAGEASAWNAPVISSPSNGASVWTGVLLDWYAVASSAGYQLQVDVNSSFNSPQKFNTYKTYINSNSSNTDTEHYLTGIFFGTTYYWRVRAFVAGDTSAWSQSGFITKDYVTLTSPANASNTWAGLVLDWDAHPGVNFYDVEADTVSSFNSPAKKTGTNAYINSNSSNTDTEFYLDNIFFGKTYYWRVRARNAVDTCSWSAVRTFNVVDYVTLSSPASGSSNWAGVVLDWTAHPGVDYYYVEADTVSSFNSPAKKTSTNTYINSNSSNTDTEFYLDNIFFGKTYYWRVRARNAVDTCSWSSVRTIIVKDFINLVAPANAALNVAPASVYINWDAHTGLDAYQFQLDTINLFNSGALINVIKNYINSNNSNTDTEYYTSTLLTNHTYFWRVRGMNAVDTTVWTSREFSTGPLLIMIPSVPALLSPANSSINQPVNISLQWSSAPNANDYQYIVSESPLFSNPVATGFTNFTQVAVNGLNLSNVTYYWKVRSRNANVAYSDWSVTWHFTTGCTAPMPSGSNDTVCEGQNAILIASGNATSVNDFLWYDAPSGGNLIFQGNPYNVNSPAQSVTVYVCILNASGLCESPRIPLTAVVLPSPPQPLITQTGNTIYSSPGTYYQWYLAGTLLSNASGQFYNPPVNGLYTVNVTNDFGCSSMSAPFNFIISGVEIILQNELGIYPNPAVDDFVVKSSLTGNYSISIIDIYGNTLAEKEVSNQKTTILNVSNYPAGIYVVKMISQHKTLCRLLQVVR